MAPRSRTRTERLQTSRAIASPITPPPTMTTSCMRSFYQPYRPPHSAKPMCYPTVMSARSRRTFQQLVTLPDGAIPLAEAALLMACEEYPQLEISPYLDQLDEIADAARPRVRKSASPMDNAAVLN